MRIVYSVLALVLVFSSTELYAQGCERDYTGTVPTEQGRGLPDSTWCFDCRDLSAFPEDFSNQAWNYVQHGGAAFTFGYYHEAIENGFSSSSTMPVRGCNTMGQCASTFVTVNFDTGGFELFGIPIQFRTGVHNYELVTARTNGANYEVTHFRQVVDQEGLPVPADTRDDGYEDGDCLDNEGNDSSSQSNGDSDQDEPEIDDEDNWDEIFDDSWDDDWNDFDNDENCGHGSGSGGFDGQDDIDDSEVTCN